MTEVTRDVHDWAAALVYDLTIHQGLHIVDPVKLHNLAYVCQGWHLVLTNKPAFLDPITASFDGPHVPALAEVCGTTPITGPWPLGDHGHLERKMPFVHDVARSYGIMPTEVIRGKMRGQPPWMDAWEAADYGRGPTQVIEISAIRAWFKEDEARTRRHHELKERLVWIETVEAERSENHPHT